MEMARNFPAHRRADRRRQAELQVYQAYADSLADGLALYSAVPPGGSEVDLVAWHVGHVRVAIDIKGGPYEKVNGIWQRVQDDGPEAVACQASKAFDAGMKLHRFLKRHQVEHSPFVVAVLVLPDLPPGHAIEQTGSQTIIVCGMEDLVERVRNKAVARHTIHFPPTWEDARRESRLLTLGQPEPEPECPSEANGAAPGDIAGLLGERGVYIERVENLHLHLDGKAATDIPA